LNTDKPEVTVLLPTFNRLAYLRAALDGLERQSFKNFELIVLDDGSSDGTREFLHRFSPWFKHEVVFADGRERAYLRNEGAKLAKAPLIAFLDDDDVWLPDKLERQVDFMNRNPQLGMTYCFTTAIDSDGKDDEVTSTQHLELYERHASRPHTFESIAKSCLIFTSSVMVRSEVFMATGGFGEDYIGSEDWDFYLKVARMSSIGVIREPLVLYRMHAGNSTAGDKERRIKVGDGRMRAAMQQLGTVKGHRARSLLMRAIAQNHYWANRNSEAVRYSLAALRESPVSFASPSNLFMLAKAAVKSIR
jgi:GT2 family glycosyltransferase